MKKLFIVGLGLVVGLVGCVNDNPTTTVTTTSETTTTETSTSTGPAAEAVTITGEYYYVQSVDRIYGVRVDVKATDEVIDEVVLYTAEQTGWIRSSDSTGTWDKNTAESAYPDYLKKFEGMTFAEVSAIDVKVTAIGQPEKVEAGQDLGELALTGATQSAGRIILAVQNAIKGERHLLGEYHHYHEGRELEYGVKVGVVVKDDKITDVKLYEDTLTGYVRTTTTWGGFEGVETKTATYLQKFIGRTVEEINALEVTVEADGMPDVITEGEVAETGATQTIGRVILAVQNALEILA